MVAAGALLGEGWIKGNRAKVMALSSRHLENTLWSHNTLLRLDPRECI